MFTLQIEFISHLCSSNSFHSKSIKLFLACKCTRLLHREICQFAKRPNFFQQHAGLLMSTHPSQLFLRLGKVPAALEFPQKLTNFYWKYSIMIQCVPMGLVLNVQFHNKCTILFKAYVHLDWLEWKLM